MEEQFRPPLDEYIATCMRHYREQHGLTAEDFARLMQQRGVRWNRATVTAIERRKRKVSAGELMALIAAMPIHERHGWTGFFHYPEVSYVQLADDVYVDLDTLDRGFAYFETEQAREAIDQSSARALASDPDRRVDGSAVVSSILNSGEAFERALATLTESERLAVANLVSEADRRASQRFDVAAEIVTLASHYLWGHGLDTQRDQLGAHGSKSHATRELYVELERAIADRR